MQHPSHINNIKFQAKSILPPTKEIQTLWTVVADWLHSLFSWDLQDTASDMPSWRFSGAGLVQPSGMDPRPKCAVVCGDSASGTERGGSDSLGPLRFPHMSLVLHSWQGVTFKVPCITFPNRVQSVHYCEFSSSGYGSRLSSVSHIVYLCVLEHASYCFGSVDLMEKYRFHEC